MTRPHTHEDRSRLHQVRSRLRMLKEQVQVNGDGRPTPDRPLLKAAAERLVYEDLDWLLNRIEENWE